jgi:hypothetical protein
MLALATLKIEAIGEGAHTTVSVDGKKWRKEYESMSEATTDAVVLRMMLPEAKQGVDEARRQPTWPWPDERGSDRPFDAFLVESTKPFEVDIDALIAHGFALDF